MAVWGTGANDSIPQQDSFTGCPVAWRLLRERIPDRTWMLGISGHESAEVELASCSKSGRLQVFLTAKRNALVRERLSLWLGEGVCGNGNRDRHPCCLGVRSCGLRLGLASRLFGIRVPCGHVSSSPLENIGVDHGIVGMGVPIQMGMGEQGCRLLCRAAFEFAAQRDGGSHPPRRAETRGELWLLGYPGRRGGWQLKRFG